MARLKGESFLLTIFLSFSLILLFFSLSNLSISYNEAEILYLKDGLLTKFMHQILEIFGYNDLALRVPFLVIYAINVILLYKVSKPILKRKFDRLFCAVLFMFLPGVLVSAIAVNEAGIAILITLLVLFLSQNSAKILLILTLALSLKLGDSFIVLYCAMFFYGIYRKNKFYILIGFVCICAFMWIYGLQTNGKPKGYLLDTIGVFAAVFSPAIFIFFIYTMYRILIKERKNLLWFIGICSFGFAFLFSLRQRLFLEDFLPYCVVCMPLLVRVFFESYRIRLPKFRIKHKIYTILAIFILFSNSFFIIFNNFLYFFIDEPKKHFAYDYLGAREIANFLKKNQIYSINTDPKTALKLKFYGINHSLENELYEIKNRNACNLGLKFKIVKFKKTIASYCILSQI